MDRPRLAGCEWLTPREASDVVRRLLAALGVAAKEAQYEGFCAGDPELPVKRAACCFSPTVEVLRRAAAEKRTLVIAREHPFYTHGTFYAAGTEAALKEDPVARAKRELIASGGLVVYRLLPLGPGEPGAQAAALAEAWAGSRSRRRKLAAMSSAGSRPLRSEALAARIQRRRGAHGAWRG